MRKRSCNLCALDCLSSMYTCHFTVDWSFLAFVDLSYGVKESCSQGELESVICISSKTGEL